MIYLTISLFLVLVVSAGLVKALLDERGRAEAMWAKERATLLQRIQAPEAAIIDHQIGAQPPMPPHVPFDDDEAFHESKEELADRLMRDEHYGAR